MPDLAAFQRQFAEALMTDHAPRSPFDVPAFAIYRNTAARGEVEALRASYPTVDILIGEEAFTHIALDYRRAHRPLAPVLSDYGAAFADHLAAQPWIDDLPYLADVARLDWLWLQSFLAPDAADDAPTVRERSRVMRHPATRFAWLETPAMTIWLAHCDGDPPTELAPDWVAEGAMFVRPAMHVSAIRIDAPLHALLAACTGAMPVDALQSMVAADCPGADFPTLLHRAVESGALLVR